MHSYITQPTVTPADRITHAMHMLTGSLADAPNIHSAHQLRALEHLRTALENWRTCYSPQQPTVPTEAFPIDPPTPVDRTQESIQSRIVHRLHDALPISVITTITLGAAFCGGSTLVAAGWGEGVVGFCVGWAGGCTIRDCMGSCVRSTGAGGFIGGTSVGTVGCCGL